MNIDDILAGGNLAEDLDKKELEKIGRKVTDGVERDISSRADWEERNAEALKLALQVMDEKTYPWAGASNVKYPLVTVACMQYNARAYPALVPGSKLVKHRVVGADPDGEKQKRADRVSSHMNYQLTSEDESWEDEMDRLLMSESLLGSCFKKTYFDASVGANISDMISADNFVTDYYTKSIETSRRKTHIQFYFKNELIEKMRLGDFVDLEDTLSDAEYNPSVIQQAADEAHGVSQPEDTTDTPHRVLECHCWLDLDDDGYEEPYVVTVIESDSKVLSIKPRFSENDITVRNNKVAKIIPQEFFTKFGFIPSPDGGFYDVGFGIILSPMNSSVNSLINQLIDAGTLSNLQSGFISKGIRIKNGQAAFTPGEWKHVNSTGDDLRKGIVPLPVRDPSQTLFQLLGLLLEAGQKIGAVSDVMQGESPGQNQPATTTMAVLEQGLKVYSSIIKRNHRALTSEFRKIYKLNALYLEPEQYFEVLDEGDPNNVYQNDYRGDPKDITPVSDPNIVSDAQRLTKAEAISVRAQQQPQFYDLYEVERRYLDAIQESGIETLMVPKEEVQFPTDPKIEMEKQQIADESEREWMRLEMDSTTNQIKNQKTMVDTQRSIATIQNQDEKLGLETAKFFDEAEFKRAELIAKTISERANKAKQE